MAVASKRVKLVFILILLGFGMDSNGGPVGLPSEHNENRLVKGETGVSRVYSHGTGGLFHDRIYVVFLGFLRIWHKHNMRILLVQVFRGIFRVIYRNFCKLINYMHDYQSFIVVKIFKTRLRNLQSTQVGSYFIRVITQKAKVKQAWIL